MKTNIRLLTITIAAALAAPAAAQSAKFTATYDTDAVMVAAAIDGSDGAAINGPNLAAEFDLASLHVAQWKEVLIGVSGQVQLMTFTQAKGKNDGGVATAIADGGVGLKVAVVPEGMADPCRSEMYAAPGAITFASRAQTLSVDVALDVVGSIPEVCDARCIEDNLAIDGDVTVALGLDTTAAHHFNFVASDLTSGWYDVVACYDLTALAEVAGLDIDADTAAETKVVLGPRIVTVQEVRATNTGIIDETGID
ncbi:MAG: hypothetical protein RQ847_03915 [Wenzhouxiangellaceae bacterium]|nr:hypothetical protein [Wenzhouxiangellaceae bacterium]